MKKISSFINNGGVGKTFLIYHLSWMAYMIVEGVFNTENVGLL